MEMVFVKSRISFVRKGIYPKISEILDKEVKEGDKILEAGCGSGLISLELILNKKNVKATLLDINEKILNKAKKNFSKHGAKARFVLGSVDDLPFKDNSFDVVFNEGVIEHAPINVYKAIAEMLRVSRREVIIIIPNGDDPIYKLKKWIYRKTHLLFGKWPWDELYGFERNIGEKYFKKYTYRKINIGYHNVTYIITK